MEHPLQILMIEDNPADAELVLRELRRTGLDHTARRVDNREDFLAALQTGVDIVLSDFDLPQFTGLQALALLRERGLETPFILISGTIGEETAVEAMRLGASDYLLKDRLIRLGSSIRQALEQARLRSARHEAEQSLRLFRALVDQSEDAIEVVDPETGHFVDVNEKGCKRLGYTREEYLRLNVADVDMTIGHLDWAALVTKLRQDGARSDEGIHRRKDGSMFPVELKLRWVHFDRDYIVASVRDISERRLAEARLRESEERFRQIAENIQEVFWVADPQHNTLLYVSPGYEAIWGRRCEDVIADPSDWTKAIHPDDRGRIVAEKKRQVEGNYDERYRVVRPDNTIRWVHDKAVPIRNENGVVYRIVGTTEDVTEHRKLEEQFLQAQKMEAIGTLAGGIAHDFNNILGAITGYTELIKMQISDNPQVETYIAAVLKASLRATSLVRQILAFSRQDSHERLPVQLRTVIKEPLELLRATIPATIAFEVELAEDIPPVLADATQIHQVIMNLCTNAAHAMGSRPGKLGVRLSRVEAPGALSPKLRDKTYVCLTISDTGKGMSREVMDRIFDPFFTTKGPGEGTGLGLAVVHGVMQSHEGDVLVHSEPGVGTVFDLYFPAHEMEVATAEPATAATIQRGNGERVLFVDDEIPIMLVGKLTLEGIGYVVEGSTNAPAALDLVRKNPRAFDVVITDLMMPEMTGLEFARQVLEIRPDMPVILTTGYNAMLTLDKIQKLGLREMLVKPVPMHELGAVMQRVLGRSRSHSEESRTP